MSLADVTRDAVLPTISEFKEIGRKQFLEKYGFGPARAYFVEYEGEYFDSKAIVGVAHGISGDRPWRAEDFSGGDRTVAQRLKQIGFTVRFVRSPDWTREEIILVCALVAHNGWRTIAQEDGRAIELSRLLQSSAIHPVEPRLDSFRNPAGVERKSSDIVSRHPDFRGKPTNGNHLDVEVLKDFLADAAGMQAQADAIRQALESWDHEPLAVGVDVDFEAEEGGVLLRQHLRRERDPRLKNNKVAHARRRGTPIACEACGFDFYQTYGERGLDYIECHHRTPLSVVGEGTTRLPDLALICSNCHRMIHRTKQWLTVEELSEVVARRRS
jgi:5-methylcytosine-specific restriction protein A